MILWVGTLSGGVLLPTVLDPVSWHAHELLFGYLTAAVAGFLLTAVPNWTGRPPLVGLGLACLFGFWLLGRLAVASSAYLPFNLVLLADFAMPVALLIVIAHEIVKGRTWRNLVVLLMLAVLITGNAVFHWEAATDNYPAGGVGLRIGLATGVMMIAVIGGRIVPAFTRNWLSRNGADAVPASFSTFDRAALLALFLTLISWVIVPNATATGFGLLIAGGLHAVRLARWAGHRTGREPLVWVLHAGYALVPIGAIALGAAIVSGESLAIPAAQHIWMAGAIGLMTLAVMTRATLGHTGRTLRADRWTAGIYLLMIAAVGVRLLATLLPGLGYEMYVISGVCWVGAFSLFVIVYGPILLSNPR